MGLTAAGTELVTGAGPGGLSVTTSIGAGVGGVFATVALVYVLAYLDLFDAADRDDEDLRATLLAAVVPLAVAFVGTVLFNVMNVIIRTV